MILLFTDFGATGPYTGQMTAVLHRAAPGVPVVGLMADAPAFRPRAAAYLLAALAPEFPAGSVFLCVVDPGVGGARRALAVEAGGRWLVGPDNGLTAIAARRLGAARWREIRWRPDRLSASFHGRDLFAPVAGALAAGNDAGLAVLDGAPPVGGDWPDDLAEVVYVDGYGNAVTGLRASTLPTRARLRAAGRELPRARTFSEVPEGAAFWYENANGLAEIAVNQGPAATHLGLGVGSAVTVVTELDPPSGVSM